LPAQVEPAAEHAEQQEQQQAGAHRMPFGLLRLVPVVGHALGLRGPRLLQRRRPGRRSRGIGDCGVAAIAGGRAADDRSLLHDVGVGRVGDDHRDVVRATAAQRQLHETLAARLGVLDVAHALADGLGADDAGEAVAADEVAVALEDLADRILRVDVAAVERAGE
jgi:hypothetical protein